MNPNYKVTIGLEIHVELKTRTKMFCPCLNDATETRPNVNVCPICLGHPGVLPSTNKKAVEAVLKLGLALDGEILSHSRFDRKSYFYPDLPKGYQISQYTLPLVRGGELTGIRITRIHLEEETAKLIHDSDQSLVDFNRAGVPLMELVTEPVIDSAEKALEFSKELQLSLRYLDVSHADMEKGQMRVEANISIREEEKEGLGTKVEIKNLNSFKAVKNAVAFEIKRQREILDKGEEVIQETRGWDETKGVTLSQREKEEAHDYRYLPEPDLPPMEFGLSELERLNFDIPEMPEVKRGRFLAEYKLPPKQVEVLVSDRYLADYFEEATSEFLTLETGEKEKRVQIIANYLTSDLIGLLNKEKLNIREAEAKIPPVNFAELASLIVEGVISSTTAKSILAKMLETGLDPHKLIKQGDLSQISDETEILKIVKEVIAENDQAVADYKKGKTNALKFLIGQAMMRLRGRGNPELLEKLFLDHLSK